ncbi:hypothetical protein DPMN_035693 [Dreissena polymorpha]|uniref:Uncharacterized protein n=1 Tax=Dreissena polymorpha TaxID=45954 RepID=A0A9D4RN58_DREPO|nr:hypothetical protein DPMN_035693 [Dreissena polymorpha]
MSLGVGEKTQIVVKVEAIQLLPKCPLKSVPLLVGLHDPVCDQKEQKNGSKQSCLTPVITSKASVSCLS